MKIMIAGAGAMGSRFGLMLHQAGNEVIFVDGWQEHIDKIKQDGLEADYNGQKIVVKIPIYPQDQVAAIDFSADLVILFTKAMQLEAMLESIKKTITAHTQVLCLLNGLGHEDVIEKYVPKSQILLGNTMWTAGLEGPGKVKLFGEGALELQSLDNDNEESAQAVLDMLNAAGLNAKYSHQIQKSIYRKACINGTMNGLCTILEANMADFGDTTQADVIVRSIIKEFVTIAHHENVALDYEDAVSLVESCYDRNNSGLHHPSMYQDLIENDRLTEIDYINGAIVRKGEKYQIATPYCAFLTQLIHCKEELLGAK